MYPGSSPWTQLQNSNALGRWRHINILYDQVNNNCTMKIGNETNYTLLFFSSCTASDNTINGVILGMQTAHATIVDNFKICDGACDYVISTPYTSSNFSVTSRNTWNNASISTFNLSMQSGSLSYNFSTTTGTISTSILQNDTNLWNLTYSSVGNYFNSVYQNINVSSNHVGYMNQSIVTIGLRNIVDNSTFTNFTIYFNTTLFCNSTLTTCTNNPLSGYYNLSITPFDNTSFHFPQTNITITALQNNTLYYYAHEHQINITAKDIITNANINNFSINFKSLNTSYEANYTTTTGLVEAFAIHNTYNITIDALGYALYNNNNISEITSGDKTLVFYLQKDNGLTINIYSENNGSSLNGTSVTVYKYINTTLLSTDITSNGTISYYSLTPANYTFRFEATNFAVKEYYVEVGNRSFQYLNAYMLQTSYNTIFTYLDETNGNTVQDVSVIVKRYINGTLQVVSSLTSDITGKVQLNYQQNTPYYFTCTKTGYTTKEFTLNPIIFSSYNVKLTPSTAQTYESDYSGVSITYTPNHFMNGQTNSLSFTFGSPEGKLTAYGFNVTYKGVTNSSSGVNAYGGVLTKSIGITGASFQNTAYVQYYYTTSDGATNIYGFNMDIVGSQSGNYTLFANRGQTYGLGDFERIIIITIILILVVGAGTMFAGQFIGGVLAMFVLGFFSYMQFITWWVSYPTMLFLFIYTVWGSSR